MSKPYSRLIARQTYVTYAKKYHLKYKEKPMKKLAREIHKYEIKNRLKKGLYIK